MPIGFAGALRQSKIVAISREDLRFTDNCLLQHIPRSKSDLGGEGVDLCITRGSNEETCPVRAMEDWLRASQCTYGPVSHQQRHKLSGPSAKFGRTVQFCESFVRVHALGADRRMIGSHQNSENTRATVHPFTFNYRFHGFVRNRPSLLDHAIRTRRLGGSAATLGACFTHGSGDLFSGSGRGVVLAFG